MGNARGKLLGKQLAEEFPDLDTVVVHNVITEYDGPETHMEARCRLKLLEMQSIHDIPRNRQLERLDELFPLASFHVLRRCIWQAKNMIFAIDSVLELGAANDTERVPLTEREFFRTQRFMDALDAEMSNRFSMLWRSSIRQVLREQNFEPQSSYAELCQLDKLREPNYWTDWWTRGKVEVGPVPPALQRELRTLAEEEDRQLACRINAKEYDDAQNFVECDCCFGEMAFEDCASCGHGHLFCSACRSQFVQHLVAGSFGTEATKRHAAGPKCFSVNGCTGVIPRAVFSAHERTMLDKFIRHQQITPAVERKLKLVCCPYCGGQSRRPRSAGKVLKDHPLVCVWLLCLQFLFYRCFYFQLGMLEIVLSLLCCCTYRLGRINRAVAEWRAKLHGRVPPFARCTNPRCSVNFCTECRKEADALHHVCFDEVPLEASLDALRAYISKAMNAVAVRVCPKCLLQFQKSDGCNLMTCRCGYRMCYICRQEVLNYQHYCGHFRAAVGQKCTSCKKCDLWRVDDNENVRDAAARAAKYYTNRHPHFAGRRVVVNGLTVCT